MKNRKFYRIILIFVVVMVALLIFFNDAATEEELKVKEFYPDAKNVKLVKDISDDIYIFLNFPSVKRAYEVDGEDRKSVV